MGRMAAIKSALSTMCSEEHAAIIEHIQDLTLDIAAKKRRREEDEDEIRINEDEIMIKYIDENIGKYKKDPLKISGFFENKMTNEEMKDSQVVNFRKDDISDKQCLKDVINFCNLQYSNKISIELWDLDKQTCENWGEKLNVALDNIPSEWDEFFDSIKNKKKFLEEMCNEGFLSMNPECKQICALLLSKKIIKMNNAEIKKYFDSWAK